MRSGRSSVSESGDHDRPIGRGVRPDHRRVWRQNGDDSRFRPTTGQILVIGVLDGISRRRTTGLDPAVDGQAPTRFVADRYVSPNLKLEFIEFKRSVMGQEAEPGSNPAVFCNKPR